MRNKLSRALNRARNLLIRGSGVITGIAAAAISIPLLGFILYSFVKNNPTATATAVVASYKAPSFIAKHAPEPFVYYFKGSYNLGNRAGEGAANYLTDVGKIINNITYLFSGIKATTSGVFCPQRSFALNRSWRQL